MALTEKQLANLRTRLGLADDVSEEDALAALEAATDDEGENPGTPDGEHDDQTDGEQGGESGGAPEGQQSVAPVVKIPPKPERQPVAASGGQGPTDTLVVSKEMFAALQTDNQANKAKLAEFEKNEATKRRDGKINAALREGRLHPKEQGAWRKALDDNEDVTTGLLESRAPVFPTSEIGHDAAPFSRNVGDVVDEASINAENDLFGITTGGN